MKLTALFARLSKAYNDFLNTKVPEKFHEAQDLARKMLEQPKLNMGQFLLCSLVLNNSEYENLNNPKDIELLLNKIKEINEYVSKNLALLSTHKKFDEQLRDVTHCHAILLERAGAYDKAERVYEALLNRFPLDWKSRYDYAVLLQKRSGKFQESIAHLVRAHTHLLKSPDLNNSNRCKIYISLIIAYMESDNSQENIKQARYYLSLVEKKGNEHQLGIICSLANKLNEIRKCYIPITNKKSFLYEEARHHDKNRFNVNHPLPSTFEKVGCEKSLASLPSEPATSDTHFNPELKDQTPSAPKLKHKTRHRRKSKPKKIESSTFEIKFKLTTPGTVSDTQTRKQKQKTFILPAISVTENDIGCISVAAEPAELSKQQLRKAWKQEGVSQSRSKGCFCGPSIWSKPNVPKLAKVTKSIHLKR